MSDKDYRRPNENWECGWQRRGFKCPSGPSAKGKCQKRGVCQPVLKDGGYICTRNGAPCEQGPLPSGQCAHQYPPCSPRRSLKAKRRLATIGAVTFTFALLLYHLGNLQPNKVFFSPGELSFNHSSFLNDCSACHSNAHADDNPLRWVFGADHRKSDSSKCLDCHSMGKHAFAAHSLPADELHKVTERIAGVGAVSSGKEMQCSQCHKEHRGSRNDLTQLSQQQCQTCHSNTFKSFAADHPEFTNYPFGQRVHILFNHSSHFTTHFEKKDKAKEIGCQTCHTTSSSGERMVLAGYESACFKCHDDQIRGESALEKGVAFLRLPGIDLAAFKRAGISVGSWPENAEGTMTSFMRLMLSQDEALAGNLDELREDEVDFEDLEDLEKEKLEKVAEIVWGIKKLLLHLSENGAEGINEAITESFGDDLNAEMKANLTASFPVEVVRSATKIWFNGELNGEVENHEAKKWVPVARSITAKLDEVEDEDLMVDGGWYRDNETFSVRYRPTGHGDKFLRSWLSISSAKSGESSSAKDVFESLSDRKETPGLCAKCHGIETVNEKMSVIYWQGTKEKTGKQDFVRFSHNSHLNLIKEDGCFTCHDLNKDADFEKVFKNNDPSSFESNFSPIVKNKCASCHQDQKVNDSCTTCHNYHIGDFFTSKSRMEKIHTDLQESGEITEAPPSEEEAAVPAPVDSSADESDEDDGE